MNTCETCQSQLLDMLYGLLEEAERREVLGHVGGCAGCRAALDAAQKHVKVLSEAAKGEFPQVRFQAPGLQAPGQKTEPAAALRVLPRPEGTSPRLKIRWGRWAMAASVLLAFVGLMYLGVAGWQERAHAVTVARRQHVEAQAKLNQFHGKVQSDRQTFDNEIRAIQNEIETLSNQWKGATDAAEATLRDKNAEVVIKGPRVVQAGASNGFQIDVHGKNRAPFFNLPLTAQIVDAKSKEVLFEKKVVNYTRFELPRNLPIKPGVDLTLVVKADLTDGAKVEVSERLPLMPTQYLTHLTTDRPMYKPGETVRFRSLTLERFSLKPPDEDLQLRYRITGPKGEGDEIMKTREGIAMVRPDNNKEPLRDADGRVIRGLGAGDFQLPLEALQGEYTLLVSEAQDRFPAERRKFLVNRYQASRLNKEVTFSQRSYGPGDKVDVSAKATRADNGNPVANQNVFVTVVIDGRTWLQNNYATDPQGNVKFFFNVPDQFNMTRGDGTVSVQFNDQGLVETQLKPLPIVLRKLYVNFYPEGGDLVAGFSNRVYFQVENSRNKPADMRGRIVDQTGKVVARVQTLHDEQEQGVNHGMGAFDFVPEPGSKYELKVDSPSGIEGKFPLPAARTDGVILKVSPSVVTDKIDATVRSVFTERQLVVGAYCRGRLVDQQTMTAKAGELTPVSLRTAPGVSGVYRLTVFEVRGNDASLLDHRAERLIYRRPVQRLNFNISANQTVYAPGERVKLRVDSSDEKGQAAPSIILLSVVDLSLLKLVDEKTARAMPTHFLLATEVRRPEDLENADFLLGEHPRASTALDLLLGTQGWRRFAEQDPQKFEKLQAAEGKRLLAATGHGAQVANNMARLTAAEVDKNYGEKFVQKQRRLTDRENQLEKLNRDEPDMRNALTIQINNAQNRTQQASQQLTRYQRDTGRFILTGVVVLMMVAGLGGLAIGLVRLANGRRYAVPFFVTGVCLLVFVFMGSLVGVFLLAGRNSPLRALLGAPDEMEMRDAMGGPGWGVKAVAPAPPPMAIAEGPLVGLPDMQRDPLFGFLEKAPVDDFKIGRGVDIGFRPAAEPMPEPMVPGAPMPGGWDPDGRFRPANAERLKRLRGDFQQLAEDRLRRKVLLPPVEEPFVVREYAHRRETPDDVRRDFSETVYWHPVLVLADGKGEVSFELSDSATRFQVLAMGHTTDGRLGTGLLEVASQLPFSLEPNVPIEISSSDKIAIPVSVTNNTDQARNVGLHAQAHGLTVLGEPSVRLDVAGRKRGRTVFHFQPGDINAVGLPPPSEARVRFLGQFGSAGSDKVEHTFKIVPDGFPVAGAHSGLLEKSVTHNITLPDDVLPGTLECKVEVFPTTLADLQRGLDGLLREPYGCFEQASSSNYPNVLILNYLEDNAKSGRPFEVDSRARKLLVSGYGRLTSFECLDASDGKVRRGYEWFGRTAPPHEALTAYGLLQFRDMAKVYPVDAAMIERTRKYLLDQRDGKGGFKRNPRALDSFGRAPDHVTNAYIVWALTETGEDELAPELTALHNQAKESSDPYFLALVGASLLNRNKSEDALGLLRNLRALQKEDGHLDGTTTSITGSGGRDLQIETTALTTLAWLKANRPDEFQLSLNKAIKWIGQQRGGHGAFGSTQATILALKALIAQKQEGQKSLQRGSLVLFLNDQANPGREFNPGQQEPIMVAYSQPGLQVFDEKDGPRLRPGNNKVRIDIGDNTLPYTLSWSYRSLKPANADGCPVHLKTSLSRVTASEGDPVRLKAIVENKSGKGQGMAVAIIGLPGGLSLPENLEQLRDMTRLEDNGTKPGLIGAFEVRGRELILYWRDLAPAQKIEVDIDVICRVPGEYKGPASRAYLYYNADLKFWTTPLEMTIETDERIPAPRAPAPPPPPPPPPR